MSHSPADIRAAIKHLSRVDSVMRELIPIVGPFEMRLERNRFRMLIRSIISQQISTKAARAIRKRVEALVAPHRLTADRIAQLPIDELRSAGLSPQKAGYIHDLSAKVSDQTVRLRTIGRRSDEEVIDELTQVKGIGRWTAQMFLIFCLGRLDVFPHDDLGIRAAIRDRYGLDELPNKSTSHEIAECWHPYASIASWYCWRSIDAAKRIDEPIA